MKTKLKDWFQTAISEVKQKGEPRDIHIDKLMEKDQEIWSKTEFYNCSIKIFEELCQIAESYDMTDLQLILQISLSGISNNIQGVFRNENQLINDIDNQFSVPEIILYKPVSNVTIPEIEFYRSILPFKISDHKKIKFFYKEYRSYEEMVSNENYNRELNLVFVP